MAQTGIILIGRNEGIRLQQCIASAQAHSGIIVYVDSGSTDDSVALARTMNVAAVELDMTIPFTAARARNAGAELLLREHPELEFLQFIDGDCQLHPQWLPTAMAYLQQNPRVAVVCGRRRERHPQASVYNLLCDMEWDTHIGEAREFGGDALIRAQVFRDLGGYDPTLIAGEEPEFAVRIRQRGLLIMRIDHEMTLHDAAMSRFGQWWNRAKRAGHALAERAFRHGHDPERDCVRERRSTLFWALLFPLAVGGLALCYSPSLALLLLGYGYLVLRVYAHRRKHGDPARPALLYAAFCVLAKVPQMLGLLVFYRNRLLGRRSRLIEYKGAPQPAAVRRGLVRIAYLVSRYPALSHTFILREVQALRALGFDIATMSIRKPRPADLLGEAERAEAASTFYVLPPPLTRLIGDHLATFSRMPGRYLRTLWRAWRLRRPGLRGALWSLFYFAEAVLVHAHCRRERIRHLHAHFANVAADVALLATHLAGRGATFSFTMHGPTEFYEVSHHCLAAKARAASLVVCISDFCRSQLMAMLEPTHWPKLSVVHCAVDTARFAPDALAAEEPEAATPRPQGAEVLCVGRLVPEKGQAILLQATAQLLARGHRLRVRFIGAGPDRANLERIAAELGVAAHVEFLGAVSQEHIRQYYRRADAFCLPSFAEGVPVVLMEAMAMGRPVISTRIMGIPELIDHGNDGLLVAPGRADQLALALEHLLENPQFSAALGRAAREKILRDFDLRRVGPQLAAIFRTHFETPAASTISARARGREAMVASEARATAGRRTGVPR